MKKTLQRYIFSEIPAPFLVGMITFTFVLLMGRFLKLAEMVVEKGVPFTDVLRLITYLLPSFWLFTLPMALLLAVLLAFGRLSGDSEITAMKSCGISLYGLLPPPMIFALITTIGCAAVTMYGVPWGNSAFKTLFVKIAQSSAGVVIKEKVFNDTFPGMVIYADEIDPKRQTLAGVIIHDERDSKEPATVFAKRGALIADPKQKSMEFHLQDGSIHRTQGKGDYKMVQFAEYNLRVSLNKEEKAHERNETEMTLAELRHPKGSFSKKELLDMRLEFHNRLALPFSCFVFTLLAMPLGIQNKRSGKAAGFSLSIAVLLLYYIALSGFKTLGQREIVPAFVSSWGPNVLFLALALYLFKKTAEEEPLPLTQFFGSLVRRFRARFSRRGRG
ncbi:LPS export ABC transporter permease LptF [Geomonas sp. RF6]|uniref:LPS export ABC transporter permease LptF n=1 Tax=Geomonas sp. RF6 TaxID=2897342 RepID=UPI001E3A1295|nr:LPS export ABC transporter permease LptF [Geomonas sp. RF6]UFS72737.1 LPS export ABC transporter permease LptF [Geomonas sp. RF6]